MKSNQDNSLTKLIVRELNNTEINSIRMLFGDEPSVMYRSDGSVKKSRVNAYAYDGKIETYLKHRKLRGEDDTRIHNTLQSWLRSVHIEGQKLGLHIELLAQVEAGIPKAIDKMCLILMKRIIERTELEKNGTSHARSLGKVVSNGFIFHLIDAAITALSLAKTTLPRSLVVLLRSVTPQNSEFYNKDRVLRNQDRALTIALCLKAEGLKVNYRNIGKILDVSASTVLRWFNGMGIEEWQWLVEERIRDTVEKIEGYRKEDPDDGQDLAPASLLPWD